MNKCVEAMNLGDVFVGDNGVIYAVVGCGGSVHRTTTRPCLRLTHNLVNRVEAMPLGEVGRIIEWSELDRRVYEYQRSIMRTKPDDAVLEHEGQNKTVVARSVRDPDEERCWLWLHRFRRAINETDPTVMFALNIDDLTALERTLNEFARLRNNRNAIHAQLDAASVPHSSLANRVKRVITERDRANQAKVVVDGPCAKYINEALDKAGVPTTFNGNDAILFDRVEWLIKQRNDATEQLRATTAELKSLQALHNVMAELMTNAGVPTLVDDRSATMPERIAWLIARVGSTGSSLYSEGLARINKALEQLKPAFDVMAAVDKLRETMEQCAQTTVDKPMAEPNACASDECGKVCSAGREMVRKAWEIIALTRHTVGGKHTVYVMLNQGITSLFDLYQFAQQQYEFANNVVCDSLDKDHDAYDVAYQRGMATAYVFMMCVISSLGRDGFEFVQHRPVE